MSASVIVTEQPPSVKIVTLAGEWRDIFGSTSETLVNDAATACHHCLYGRREVRLVAPLWIRKELRSRGFVNLK